jgi:hypothetical protein
MAHFKDFQRLCERYGWLLEELWIIQLAAQEKGWSQKDDPEYRKLYDEAKEIYLKLNPDTAF